MENPNLNIAASTTRTFNYGSTTLNTNSNQHSRNIDSDESLANRFAYQSLPSSSSANLFRKAPFRRPRDSASFVILSSRAMKMSGEKSKSSEGTRQFFEGLQITLNVVNQICIGFVTIYMSWLCLRTGLAGTAIHAWLVTIGFSFLMAEAMMCHYGNNVLTSNYKRTTKTTIHWMLQVLGGGCGVAGALIKAIQKNFALHSIHGKLGFSAFILCLVSMLAGLSALFSQRLKKAFNPLLNKTFHNFLGIGTFAVALSAQYYGYETGFFSRKVSSDFQVLMKCVTLISLFLTCIGPLKALFHKIGSISRHF